MSKQTLIISMRPKFMELREQRTYSEAQVKKILFGFARDLGCKWNDEELRSVIETVFDFD